MGSTPIVGSMQLELDFEGKRLTAEKVRELLAQGRRIREDLARRIAPMRVPTVEALYARSD